MPPDVITDAEVLGGMPIIGPAGFGKKTKDWIDYFNSSITGNFTLPINGSFEIDSDADGDPDQWDITDYPGGTHSLDTSNASHGVNCLKFTASGGAGNGGGYADSLGYIEVSDLHAHTILVELECSVTGVDVRMEMREYNAAKIYQSSQTVYSSTSNPTSYAVKALQYTPASGIKYIKIRLIGGYTNTIAGDIYFDNVILARRYSTTYRYYYNENNGVEVTPTIRGNYHFINNNDPWALKIYTSSGWITGTTKASDGLGIYCDGNVKIQNNTGSINTIYYNIIDMSSPI